MNARLSLGITFGFVSGRRMVKVVIDQTFMALHQRHQLRDSPSTFEVYHLLWTRVFEGRIKTEKYLEVLECLWPTVQQHFADGRYIFQEDNAPTHKANLVKRYFQEKNTIPILWPMYSPDLSPIDNCWSLLKMRLQKEIH